MVVVILLLNSIQSKLRICLALVERLAFTFQRGYTLFQFRLLKQIYIIRKDCHIFREIYA